jgi:hypothetical protein
MKFRPTFTADADLHYCEVTNRFHILQAERQAAGLDPQFACGLTPEASWVWMELMKLPDNQRSELAGRMQADARSSSFVCTACWRCVR